jgi:cAMP-binding proteins - catabolite gene activator and regulatory subunit of cAMP-dependent protein kinases
MYEKWLNIINASPLFHEIEPSQLSVMLNCMRPRVNTYKKNENITIEGEPFEGIGVMLKGEAAITRESPSGSRVILEIAGPSRMFGEIAAFSGRKVWPATVAAQGDCTVMFLPPEKILSNCEKLCLSHKTLVNNMLRIVSDRAFMLNKKVEYLTMKNIREKLSSYLLDQYRVHGSSTFMMPMKRNELADFLNVSRPSLSREMCKMRDEGLIEFHRSSIRIRDLENLKNMIY